jgi:hypothetical protein
MKALYCPVICALNFSLSHPTADCGKQGAGDRLARGRSRPTAPREPSIAAQSLPNRAPARPDRPAVEWQRLAHCRHMPTPDAPPMRVARPLPVVGDDRRGSVSCYLDGASASSSNSRKPNRNLPPEALASVPPMEAVGSGAEGGLHVSSVSIAHSPAVFRRLVTRGRGRRRRPPGRQGQKPRR